MTEEAIADLILGLTQETEVGAAQDIPVQTDMPAGTETLDEGTHPKQLSSRPITSQAVLR